ncbi:hypothetical protein M431DRAFT_509631 [Trichoderma harzianum CBS 226.95]|uniref:Extracellular membrane protein CFEM domain-containing protein n=1 Tax=Trichoderma harzianum CBS 226.95 TaxID=983964 RepID=A0A2T4A8H1_TRIHA|nr:hypothetical protein M431DRAFT_509631 [Trichoderma harzianum CBS 226.95]PTB53351.1 hypothetical protein M431DRAFT_509631 [Trichoderma harzianum CBS 226.95]
MYNGAVVLCLSLCFWPSSLIGTNDGMKIPLACRICYLPYQPSESPAITTSCISTIPSDCRSGPAVGSDGASAAPSLCDLISLYGVPRGNNCVAVINVILAVGYAGRDSA